MNPEQPDRPDDEFDAHLAGKSAVSRLYQQAAREAPSAELDARIRQAARQRLITRKSRWVLPLSAAAAVVLAFGVLLEMQQEGMTPLPQEATPTIQDFEASTPVAAPASTKPPAPAANAPAAPAEKRAAPFPGEDARKARLPAAAPTRAERRADAITPKERLARIRQLRSLGRDREAQIELDDFRQQFPDYPLPADMK